MEITQKEKDTFRLKAKNVVVELARKVTIRGKSDGFVIDEPGEYEIEGVSVFAYRLGESGRAYLLQCEGVRVLFIPEYEQEMSEACVDELGVVDVLIFIRSEAKLMVKLVEAVEPSYVLPAANDSQDSFVKTYERGSRAMASLVVSATSLPSELTEVIVLNR